MQVFLHEKWLHKRFWTYVVIDEPGRIKTLTLRSRVHNALAGMRISRRLVSHLLCRVGLNFHTTQESQSWHSDSLRRLQTSQPVIQPSPAMQPSHPSHPSDPSPGPDTQNGMDRTKGSQQSE